MDQTTSKRKKIFVLLIILVITVGLLVSLKLAGQKQEIRKKAAGTGVSLSISPANTNITNSETFSIGVTVDTGDDTVTAAELHLTYDQSKIEAQSISAGSFLPVVLTQGKIGTGSASITLGSQPSEPKKGTGILATLTFKALSPSTSQINFDSSTHVAAVGKTGNEVQSVSGSQVTVNPSASSAPVNPTPTITYIPTSSPTVGPSVTPIPRLTPSTIPTFAPTNIPIPTTSSCVIPRPCLFYSTPCIEPTPVQGYCPLPPTPNITILPSLVTVTSTTVGCPKKSLGDTNCDNQIDGLDYSIWLNTQCHRAGSQTCSDKRADYNQDGNIDDEDYQIWLTHRNQ